MFGSWGKRNSETQSSSTQAMDASPPVLHPCKLFRDDLVDDVGTAVLGEAEVVPGSAHAGGSKLQTGQGTGSANQWTGNNQHGLGPE